MGSYRVEVQKKYRSRFGRRGVWSHSLNSNRRTSADWVLAEQGPHRAQQQATPIETWYAALLPKFFSPARV